MSAPRPALRRLLVDPLESRRLLAVGVVGTAEPAVELLDISLLKASPTATLGSPLSIVRSPAGAKNATSRWTRGPATS